MPRTLHFFLGGHDLEMVTIRELLQAHASGRVHDRGLAWGARASAYRAELDEALRRGATPVLVELEDDLNLGARGAVIVVDHHADRAGQERPTSLHQVFGLLALPPSAWTRWHELVAANDVGHVRGLLRAGATPEEIARVRAADRAAQGITPEHEAEGARAVKEATRPIPGLAIVRLSHDKTAVVADRLEPALGGPATDNLLVLSPEEVNFYGSGNVVNALMRRYGGWTGGSLPERGFWGHAGAVPGIEAAVVEELTRRRIPEDARAARRG